MTHRRCVLAMVEFVVYAAFIEKKSCWADTISDIWFEEVFPLNELITSDRKSAHKCSHNVGACCYSTSVPLVLTECCPLSKQIKKTVSHIFTDSVCRDMYTQFPWSHGFSNGTMTKGRTVGHWTVANCHSNSDISNVTRFSNNDCVSNCWVWLNWPLLDRRFFLYWPKNGLFG